MEGYRKDALKGAFGAAVFLGLGTLEFDTIWLQVPHLLLLIVSFAYAFIKIWSCIKKYISG